MKALWLSHSSVIPTYRHKLELLGREKGMDLTLAVPEAWPEAGRRVLAAEGRKAESSFSLRALRVKFEGRLKWHYYPGFSRLAREISPDLIHAEEEPYSFAALQAARAARRLGAAFTFFTWENLLTGFGPIHDLVRSYVLMHADFCLAGNREAVELLVRSGYPKGRTAVVPQYGVDPELFRPQNAAPFRKKLGLKGFTVGYAGRLVAEKGLLDLLEAFTPLGRRGATLLMLGGGPLRETLEAEAKRAGIGGRLKFVPALPQTQVPSHLNAMDVLVLPSRTAPKWKEQFGRVIIEAQACGVPVVGSDSGAIPEVLGGTGLVFPEGDVAGLRAQLERLMSAPALRRKLGAMGKGRVLAHYTNARLAHAISRIHREIVERRRKFGRGQPGSLR